MSDYEIVKEALYFAHLHAPNEELLGIGQANAALERLRRDSERLDWLSQNDVIQQEVGSNGWTLPEKDFRSAIDAAMEEARRARKAMCHETCMCEGCARENRSVEATGAAERVAREAVSRAEWAEKVRDEAKAACQRAEEDRARVVRRLERVESAARGYLVAQAAGSLKVMDLARAELAAALGMRQVPTGGEIKDA